VNPFRRPRPPEPPSLSVLLERGLPETNIAIGNLSGTDPSDIAGHLLVVISHDGTVRLSGTGSPEAAVMVLAELTSQLARQAFAGRERGEEGAER
jgi:hypothetical protein